MNRRRWRSVLRGSEDGIDVASAVLAVAVAAGMGHVLAWGPGIGGPAFEVSPMPNGFGEWVVVAAAVALTAVIGSLGGGWLACWWFSFPSFSVLYLHYYTVGSGGIVVIGLPTISILAAIAAGVCGIAGYLLGRAGRRGYALLGPVDVRSQLS